MSAFEVDTVHIDVMVSAALQRIHGDHLSWYYGENSQLSADGTLKGSYENYQAELNRMRREVTPETAGYWGAALVAENRRSVNFRYEEDEIEAPYQFTEYVGHFDPVKMLAAISCYEYQACEHPGWKTSEARAFCEALRMRLIGQLHGYGSFHGHCTDAAQVTIGQPMRVKGRLGGVTFG